jgi:hypothetical protein
MTAYLFYTKGSPHERQIQDLAEELGRRQVEVELVEADSSHGIQLSENYDVLARPAVVLAASDGSVINTWQEELPTPSDVSYWAHR